jgi:hypothetical protein
MGDGCDGNVGGLELFVGQAGEGCDAQPITHTGVRVVRSPVPVCCRGTRPRCGTYRMRTSASLRPTDEEHTVRTSMKDMSIGGPCPPPWIRHCANRNISSMFNTGMDVLFYYLCPKISDVGSFKFACI